MLLQLKTLFKYNRTNIILLVCLLILFIMLFKFNVISANDDFTRADFFNILTINAILAGFLFIGLGILLSSLDKERIARLDMGGYLDKYYVSIYIAIFFNILCIICSIMIIFNILPLGNTILIYTVQITTIAGVIFFINSMNGLRRIIKKMRNSY